VPEREPPAQGFALAPSKKDTPAEIELSNLEEMERPISLAVKSPEQIAEEEARAVQLAYEEETERLMEEQSQTPTGKSFLPIVRSESFQNLIIVTHLVNCLQLATTDPRGNEEAWFKELQNAVDITLIVVFTVEMGLMHLALGFRLYWRDAWNCLDGSVVVVGYLRFFPGIGNTSVVRVLRILRPLRVVGKVKGMRVIIQTLNNSFKPLLDAMALALLVVATFGILGLYLFGGSLSNRCHSTSSNCANISDCVIVLAKTRRCGGEYSCDAGEVCVAGLANPNYGHTHFDNILVGVLSIFVAITLEGWVDVMYLVQDSVNYWLATLFFHSLILFGSLFTLNLALAVISDSYGRMMEEEIAEMDEEGGEGDSGGEDSSQDEDDLSRIHSDPRVTTDVSLAEQIARSNTFAYCVLVFILLNTGCLAADHVSTGVRDGVVQAVEIDAELKRTLNGMNYVFTGVFALELVVKLYGIGWREYVADRFNVFDAVIVILSFVELGYSENSSISVLRAFRLARIFKLVKSWTSLRKLIEIIGETLPSVGYLSIVMLFFMFVMSILGMNFFGGRFEPPALDFTPRINFDNFLVSMLTVFQILTGENWNEVLYHAMTTTSSWSVIYFPHSLLIAHMSIYGNNH